MASSARETPSSTSRSISATTKRASACSSASSRTLIVSPSPISVHSDLTLRPRLLATTAFAALRMVCVER